MRQSNGDRFGGPTSGTITHMKMFFEAKIADGSKVILDEKKRLARLLPPAALVASMRCPDCPSGAWAGYTSVSLGKCDPVRANELSLDLHKSKHVTASKGYGFVIAWQDGHAHDLGYTEWTSRFSVTQPTATAEDLLIEHWEAGRLDLAEATIRDVLKEHTAKHHAGEVHWTPPQFSTIGRAVLMARWSEDLASLYAAALKVPGTRCHFDIEDVREKAAELDVLRDIIKAEGRLSYKDFRDRAKQQRITRTSEELKILTHNLEVHRSGDHVIAGPGPDFHADATAILPKLDDRGNWSVETQSYFLERFWPALLDGAPLPHLGIRDYVARALDILKRALRHNDGRSQALAILQVMAHSYPEISEDAATLAAETELLSREENGEVVDWGILLRPENRQVAIDEVLDVVKTDHRLSPWGVANEDRVLAALGQIMDDFELKHGVDPTTHIWNEAIAAVESGSALHPFNVEDFAVGYADIDQTLQSHYVQFSVNGLQVYGLAVWDRKSGNASMLADQLVWDKHLRVPLIPTYSGYWLQQTIRYRLIKLLRDAENMARQSAGMRPVGEEWISEANMVEHLRVAFPSETIKTQASPPWLAKQRFDAYFPDHKVAVEYQGAQHSQPVEYFGGEDAFARQQERDERKRRACAENGIRLIEVHPGYDPKSLVERVEASFSPATKAVAEGKTDESP